MRVLCWVGFVLCGAAALGQSAGVAEWPTGSFDQQRDGWQRTETKLSVDTAKNIRLLWKLKTDNKPMGMQSFREPVIVARRSDAGNFCRQLR